MQYQSATQQELICSYMRFLFIIKSNNYKLQTHIHFNYSIEKKKKEKKTTTTTTTTITITTTLEEYFRIKIDIKCAFLFLLNFKTNYISQTPAINHTIYKTHKSIMFDLMLSRLRSLLLTLNLALYFLQNQFQLYYISKKAVKKKKKKKKKEKKQSLQSSRKMSLAGSLPQPSL